MSSDGQATQNKHRTNATRRRGDKLLVGALAGACAFLFVVAVLQGAYILKVVSDVDDQSKSLTKFVCFQNSAFHAALDREKKLIKSAPSNQRAAHAKSAAQLKGYLMVIDNIVDCSGIKFAPPKKSD